MKFNQTQKTTSKTTNFEGGVAYKMDIQTELYTRVATWLVNEPKFYGDKTTEMQEILDLINKVGDKEPKFLLQLASYARNKLHLRSAPILLLGEASCHPKARSLVRPFVPDIIKRADELCEIIAYMEKKIGKLGDEEKNTMLPNNLRKGLENTMHNFNEYQYSKYDRNDAAVTMQDVIRLVHPIAKSPEEGILFGKIAKDELGSADTWEVLTMKEGSNKETWEKAATKMPIMALLRNLRNLLDNNVSEQTIDYAVSQLTNPSKIRNSKQFPFRFLSAYKSIEDYPKAGKFLSALDRAMDISIDNLPNMDGITAVFSDNSDSMNSKISEKSQVSMKEVGNTLAAIASKLSNNINGVFGEDFATLSFSDQDSILTRTQKLCGKNVGYSTNGYKAFDYLIREGIKVDRIFLFSDMQCYDDSGYDSSYINNSWREYKRRVNKDCYLYSFDLRGYGTVQIPQGDPRVLIVAGWSENILKYVPYFEMDRATVLDEIRQIRS